MAPGIHPVKSYGNNNFFTSHAQLLMNGKVLLTSSNDKRAFLLEPNASGSYENGTLRQIADMPYSHVYNCLTIMNDGRVMYHGSEYNDGVSSTSVYHPDTETWTGYPSVIASHRWVGLDDEGRCVGFSKNIEPDGENPASGTPAYTQTDVPDYTESGAVLLPDGRFALFEQGNVKLIEPNYAPGTVSGGSFDGDGEYVASGASFHSSALAADWRYGGLTVTAWASLYSEVGYERGPAIWMHKIQKAAIVSGMGTISTYDPVANQIARPAVLPVEPPQSANALSKVQEIGTLHSDHNGQTPSDLDVADTFKFVWNPVTTSTLAQTFIDRITQLGWRYISIFDPTNTKVALFRINGASYDSGTGIMTVTGVQRFNVTSMNDALATGCKIAWGFPRISCKDSPGAILPNGDFIFIAGSTRASSWDGFSQFIHLMKWDGSSSEASYLSLSSDGGNLDNTQTHGTQMFMLPDGNVFIKIVNGFNIYEPTSAEATPVTASRPVISSFPGVITPGSVVTLQGSQLNGLTEGGSFGDDGSPRTNFPVVRFVNNTSGEVKYGTTFDHSYRGIQPNRSSQCSVKIPSALGPGSYSVYVVANGIPSLAATARVRSGLVGSSTMLLFDSTKK